VRRALANLAVWSVVAGIASGVSAQTIPLVIPPPPGFPPPAVPSDNPLTEAKAELGRHLFFDTRLSADGSFACSTCHQSAHAFTDSRPRAVGVTGDVHPRSSMTLTNVAYNASLNWADPTLRRLEEQMTIPMFSVDPVEMGISGHEDEVLLRLQRESRYGLLFQEAFSGDADSITLENVIRAIASFERSLISGRSAYDRYVYWDEREDFPESARRGMGLFFSARLGCSECHSGFNFSGPVVYADGPSFEPVFHNTALYDLDGAGSYPEGDQGLIEHTELAGDMGRFRAPTLRNIALTAPYMHDGSLQTLEGVIAHYAAGGRAAGNPLKSDRLDGFAITAEETRDLVTFLESLTDREFLHDSRFADPWSSP